MASLAIVTVIATIFLTFVTVYVTKLDLAKRLPALRPLVEGKVRQSSGACAARTRMLGIASREYLVAIRH
jgi:hypothetical protein